MSALLCAQCGGPLPKTAAREAVTCTFCGTTAAPAPRVIEKVVDHIHIVEARGDSEVHCPRCGGAMRDAEARNARLFVCTCGGMWLDPKTVERLTRERDDELTDRARRAIGPFAPKDRDRRPLLACPACKTQLRRAPLGETAESYDVCDTHGAFFDHGELKTFIASEAERRAGTVDADDVAAAGLGGWRWPWS